MFRVFLNPVQYKLRKISRGWDELLTFPTESVRQAAESTRHYPYNVCNPLIDIFVLLERFRGWILLRYPEQWVLILELIRHQSHLIIIMFLSHARRILCGHYLRPVFVQNGAFPSSSAALELYKTDANMCELCLFKENAFIYEFMRPLVKKPARRRVYLHLKKRPRCGSEKGIISSPYFYRADELLSGIWKLAWYLSHVSEEALQHLSSGPVKCHPDLWALTKLPHSDTTAF